MAGILHLETSTSVCSVALSVDGKVVFEKVAGEGLSHAALLGVFAEEATGFALSQGVRVDAVAVGGGPGSYTGLRIGTSLAKGLCMGWGVPLIAVPTLKLMAFGARRRFADPECLYCAMIDARRMEVYAAIYDAQLTPVRETQADIVTSDTYRAFLEQGRVLFFGNGAAKCKAAITSHHADNAFFMEYRLLAADMTFLAEQA
ncbi:MAG: tRNA (adenosine(37)-N6)-threonylcarbamoyltransferase complex dimerization subunit type 1 TsaB, partial [Tannerella sp.]|nr:tRNA (adenosine(37)-N6)-threonylcarbamoyltransferase complex dimerization subunit type 1 TsaB [Tannerella sp.]